jgi:hypothetical protein
MDEIISVATIAIYDNKKNFNIVINKLIKLENICYSNVMSYIDYFLPLKTEIILHTSRIKYEKIINTNR